MSIFYEVKSVPVHSVLLMPTPEVALNYPKRDIILGFCPHCGFIANLAYDPGMQEYSSNYEETQGFSPTFNAFIQDFYSEKYGGYQGDFVCCKMTLEHIQHTADFVRTVRRSIGNRMDTIVFFQVPDVSRILRELAFWDIYYEHCSYFSLGSLARLFRNGGFDVLDLRKDYEDQYLMIEARPRAGNHKPSLPQENDLQELASEIAYFADHCQNKELCFHAFYRNINLTRSSS